MVSKETMEEQEAIDKHASHLLNEWKKDGVPSVIELAIEGAESLMCGLSRLDKLCNKLIMVCNNNQISIDQGVDILDQKAAHFFGTFPANVDISNIVMIRSSKGTNKGTNNIGLHQIATCLAASRRLDNDDPTIIFHTLETNCESFNNHELLMTFASFHRRCQ